MTLEEYTAYLNSHPKCPMCKKPMGHITQRDALNVDENMRAKWLAWQCPSYGILHYTDFMIGG